MDEQVKAKWVAALRSGEYKQAQRVLKTDTGYCCLGVLCELYRQEHPEASWQKSEVSDGRYKFHTGSGRHETDWPESTILTWGVAAWAGLNETSPSTRGGVSLTHLNDRAQKSFREIADVIEKGL